MTHNPEISRSKAWRRTQSRRVSARVAQAASWLSQTVAKRKADRPAPVAGAKEHQHGKLTMIQRQRQRWTLDQELRDENYALAPVPGAVTAAAT